MSRLPVMVNPGTDVAVIAAVREPVRSVLNHEQVVADSGVCEPDTFSHATEYTP